MSRSYHKTPNCCVKNPYAKRLAKRKARRSKDDLQNSAYRKLYDSWDIKDYKEIGTSFEHFYNHMLKQAKALNEEPLTEKEARKLYYKWYKRK